MTDQAIDEDVELEEGEGDEGPARKRWSGKRIVLFIVLPVLLLAGGAGGAYFAGALDFLFPHEEAADAAPEQTPPGKAVFLELPDMLVNLNSSGRRGNFLKIKISLEVGSQDDIKTLEAVMPRVIDNFHVYLRELRPEDLKGSAGLYRLREELLRRVQVAAEPAVVKDVLFKEMLIQ